MLEVRDSEGVCCFAAKCRVERLRFPDICAPLGSGHLPLTRDCYFMWYLIIGSRFLFLSQSMRAMDGQTHRRDRASITMRIHSYEHHLPAKFYCRVQSCYENYLHSSDVRSDDTKPSAYILITFCLKVTLS